MDSDKDKLLEDMFYVHFILIRVHSVTRKLLVVL